MDQAKRELQTVSIFCNSWRASCSLKQGQRGSTRFDIARKEEEYRFQQGLIQFPFLLCFGSSEQAEEEVFSSFPFFCLPSLLLNRFMYIIKIEMCCLRERSSSSRLRALPICRVLLQKIRCLFLFFSDGIS